MGREAGGRAMKRKCVVCGDGIAHRPVATAICERNDCRLERIRRRDRERYHRDPVRMRERNRIKNRRKYMKNPQREIERSKLWRQNNLDKSKASSRKRYLERRVELLAYNKRYRLANKEKIRRYAKQYYEKRAAALKLLQQIEQQGLDALL